MNNDLTPEAQAVRDGIIAARRAIERGEHYTPAEIAAYERRCRQANWMTLGYVVVMGLMLLLFLVLP